MLEKDPNDIESLQQLPDDEILEIKDENEVPVSKCRKGFGKFIVTNSEHFVIFVYEFKVKDPNLENVRNYLKEKYPNCEIKEVR